MPQRAGRVTGFYDKIAGAARLTPALLLSNPENYKCIPEVKSGGWTTRISVGSAWSGV